MSVPLAGYKEIEHTADWAIRVWAPDLPTLFVQAAEGMLMLAQFELEEGNRLSRSFKLHSQDVESLLVAFLEELLFIGEQEDLGFDKLEVEIGSGCQIDVLALGGRIASRKKEIKAVTFHNLAVKQTDAGYQVEVVFDV